MKNTKHLLFLSIFFLITPLYNSQDDALKKWVIYRTINAGNDYTFCHGAFSSDYKKFACSSSDGIVRVINLADGAIEATLETTVPTRVLRSEYPLVYSPDNTIIVGDHRRTFRAFLPDGTTITKDLPSPYRDPKDDTQYQAEHLALTKDGKLLATVDRCAFTTTLWDTQTWQPKNTLTTIDGEMEYWTIDIAFMPDSKRLIDSRNGLRGRISQIKIWDCQTGQELQSIPTDIGTCVACHPQNLW